MVTILGARLLCWSPNEKIQILEQRQHRVGPLNLPRVSVQHHRLPLTLQGSPPKIPDPASEGSEAKINKTSLAALPAAWLAFIKCSRALWKSSRGAARGGEGRCRGATEGPALLNPTPDHLRLPFLSPYSCAPVSLLIHCQHFKHFPSWFSPPLCSPFSKHPPTELWPQLPSASAGASFRGKRRLHHLSHMPLS